MGDKGTKRKRSFKVKMASGKTHNFTARNVSVNKLASRKVDLKKLEADLAKKQTLLDASDIPIC